MSEGKLKGKRYLLAAEYVEYGGTRNYFKDLLLFYKRNGADVVAVTSFAEADPDMASFVESLGFKLLRYADITRHLRREVDNFRPSIWSNSLYQVEVEVFARIRSQYDLEAVTLSVGTSGLFLSAVSGVPNSIMIAHGYPHGIRQRIFGRMLLAPKVPEDLQILSVSEYSGNRFRRTWDTKTKRLNVQTTYSTCGPSLSPVPLESRESLVMTAALIEDYKEPYDWIEIANRVITSESTGESFQFMWVGDGSKRLTAQSKTSQAWQASITFPGWSDDLKGHYEMARVYLQTSSKESLGLSVVDALRYGLPSVVTNAGGLPEVVLDGVNGFVVPVGDIDGAAEAILELLRNDSLWRKQARSALELYREKFSATSWNDALLKAHLN